MSEILTFRLMRLLSEAVSLLFNFRSILLLNDAVSVLFNLRSIRADKDVVSVDPPVIVFHHKRPFDARHNTGIGSVVSSMFKITVLSVPNI